MSFYSLACTIKLKFKTQIQRQKTDRFSNHEPSEGRTVTEKFLGLGGGGGGGGGGGE